MLVFLRYLCIYRKSSYICTRSEEPSLLRIFVGQILAREACEVELSAVHTLGHDSSMLVASRVALSMSSENPCGKSDHSTYLYTSTLPMLKRSIQRGNCSYRFFCRCLSGSENCSNSISPSWYRPTLSNTITADSLTFRVLLQRQYLL